LFLGTIRGMIDADAPTRKQAQELVKRLQNEADELGISATYIADKAARGRMETAYTGSFAKSLHKMDTEQLKFLESALIKAGHDKEAVKQFIRVQEKYAYKKAASLSPRAEERLKGVKPRTETTPFGEKRVVETAPMEPALESIAAHLDWVADYTGNAVHNTQLDDMFKRTFSDVMKDKANVQQPILNHTGRPELETEAKLIQEQLRVVSGYKSKYQLKAEAIKEASALRLERSKHPTVRLVGKMLDNGPGIWELANFAKGVTVASKLGLGALGQLPLQFSLIMNSIFASAGRLAFQGNVLTKQGWVLKSAQAKAIALAQVDFMQAVAPNVIKGLPFNKKGRDAWNFVQRSGMAADVNFEELRKLYQDVNNMRGLTGSLIRPPLKAGLYPMKKGEELSRVYALMVAKRNIEKKVKLGLHETLGLNDIKGGGYSDKFVEEASKEAQVFALNMSKINQPKFARGLLGVPMMFENFGVQQSRVFFNKKNMSKAALAGIWLGWAGAFGLRGIPFMWDVLTFGEDIAVKVGGPEYSGVLTEQLPRYAATKITEKLEDTKLSEIAEKVGLDISAKEFWFRYAVQGIDSALTEGQMSIGTRASISELFSHYTSASPLADLIGGPPGQVMRSLLRDVPETIEDLKIAIEEADGVTSEVAYSSARKLSTEFVGPNSLIRAGEAAGTGELRNKQGFVEEADPTLLDIMQTAISFTPGDIALEKQVKGHVLKAQKAWAEWMKDKAKRVAKAYVFTPDTGEILFNKYQKEIAAYNPDLLRGFFNLTMFIRINGDIEVEKQNELLAVQNIFIAQSIKSGWDF